MKWAHKRILSVLPVLGQPRDSKRVTMLQSAGFHMRVAYFDRRYHKGRTPNCEAVCLGELSHGKYLKRIIKIMIALPRLRRMIRDCDLVYASGPDMAYMALLAGAGLKIPIVLEVGDIREIQLMKGVIGNLIRRVDRLFLMQCALLVATTTDFIQEYYRKWLKADVPSFVLENKLERTVTETYSGRVRGLEPGVIGKERPLRVGYFGLLRCEWTWEVLKKWAGERPNEVEIVIAGFNLIGADIGEQVKGHDNIRWLGEYRSPEDLPDLYGSVDIIWACYHYIHEDDWNLKWARTNRFYESCFFQRPIIARSGSSDGKNVKAYDIGMTVVEHQADNVIQELAAIDDRVLRSWGANLKLLPTNVYSYTTEENELKERIIGSIFDKK